MADNNQPLKKITPWGLHPLEPMIEEEYKRRTKEYGLNPTNSPTNDKPYSGGRTAWTRVFSNGISATDERNKLNGFLIGGGEGFDESYGFGADGKITIGVDAYGKKHEIPAAPRDPALGVGSDLPHRPPPSVVSVECEFSGGNSSGFNALCRKTKVSWKCYSLTQLEYMVPYFLTPRITLLVEWGWNNYDKSSLVNLWDTEALYSIFLGEEKNTYDRIRRSHGNYDLAFGFISDYGYTMNEYGGYDCFTTIMNANYLIEGKAYQNSQNSKNDKNDPSGSLKLKDFNEFVFDDLDNLVIKNSKAKNITVQSGTGTGTYGSATNFAAMKQVTPVQTIRDDSQDIKSTAAKPLLTKGKVFRDDEDQWIRMDLVVDILNRFFEIGFLDSDNKDTKIQANKLDIEKVAICAHPAIKSTSPNFIIPNKYAPRFVSADGETQGADPNRRKTLSGIQKVGNMAPSSNPSPTGEYYKLFPNVLKVMKENKFDDSYDDLVEALLTKGARPKYESFPSYSDYTDNNAKNSPLAGYWGYLEDIFVSVKYFKEKVEKNDTVLKLIEELIKELSESMCSIVQLKCVPDTNGGSKYTIMDVNFSPVNTPKQAAELPRFVLNAVDYAFMKSNSFSMKITGEMANQMIAQSASGKKLPEGFGTANYDPKTAKYSRFSRGDRLFARGILTPEKIEDSNKSGESEKQKYTRMLTDENPDLYLYTFYVTEPGLLGFPKKGKKYVYILTEKSNAFMKSILLEMKNKKAIYTNNGIMPGTEFRMETFGIGGITFLSQFTLDHVPDAYNYKNAVWQIADVKHKIENKMWTTSVMAQARPLTSIE